MEAFNPLGTWNVPEESKPRRVHSAALRRSSDAELVRTTTATRAARRRDARGLSGTRPRRAPANRDDVDDEASADEDIASRGGGVEGESRATGLRVGKSGRCRPERAPGMCAGGAVARAPPPRITRDTSDPGLGTRLLDTSAPQFFVSLALSARDMAEDAPPPAPWWAAPASGVVTAPRRPPGDAGSASSSGAFGCDVRTEHGRRKRGARPPPISAPPRRRPRPPSTPPRSATRRRLPRVREHHGHVVRPLRAIPPEVPRPLRRLPRRRVRERGHRYPRRRRPRRARRRDRACFCSCAEDARWRDWSASRTNAPRNPWRPPYADTSRPRTSH